ncbi:MAG: enterochelin esterase family protein [Cellvibrionaceae bacterium]|jgi:enterochelin esterase family protein
MNWIKLLGVFWAGIFLLASCTLLNLADLPPLIATNTPFPLTATPLPTITPTPIPEKHTVEGFKNFIAEVEATERTQRQGLVNKYVVNAPQNPIVTSHHAIFLWQGTPDNVGLIGDMTFWNPEKMLPLTRLTNTDLWYRIEPFEPDARLDYMYLVDDETQILDPANPNQMKSGFGRRSVLAMPGYTPPAELVPTVAKVPAGTLTTETIDSQALAQVRTLFVYTPVQPPQNKSGKYPSVYIHDGSDYLNFIDTTVILDRLIADGRITPLVAVFIPPIDRRVEYQRHDAYVEFLTDEAVPFIQEKYNTSPDPAETGSLGASMGGLISVYAGLNRPDVFGLVGSQSGALSYGGDGVIRQVELMQAVPVRFYLTIGSYETELNGDTNQGNLLAGNERFVTQLRSKGYEYEYEVRPQGHSWGFWQVTLGETLIWLYGD